jgi:anti-sigma B factor antagonist
LAKPREAVDSELAQPIVFLPDPLRQALSPQKNFSCQQEPSSGALLKWALMVFPWRKMTKAMARSEDVVTVFKHRGSECQALLTGRITIDSSPDLRETLLKQLASLSCRTLTIDFNEVAYVDTSGLAMLVEILKAARTQGKEFQLTGLKERPRYLLETTRLLRFFHEANSDTVQKSDSSESPQ